MPIKIEQKITGFKVLTEATKSKQTELVLPTPISKLPRLSKLNSQTYRLKPPQAEHALYVTLSYITVNDVNHPYEIFFNTKNPEHIEWTNALTLTISIAFRTAIDTQTPLTGLVANLKETFGVSGGYVSKIPSKPKFVNGIVAEIGLVIEEFCESCLQENLRDFEALPEPTLIDKMKKGLSDIGSGAKVVPNPCPECGESMRISEGCLVCNCGFSKCS